MGSSFINLILVSGNRREMKPDPGPLPHKSNVKFSFIVKYIHTYTSVAGILSGHLANFSTQPHHT